MPAWASQHVEPAELVPPVLLSSLGCGARTPICRSVLAPASPPRRARILVDDLASCPSPAVRSHLPSSAPPTLLVDKTSASHRSPRASFASARPCPPRPGDDRPRPSLLPLMTYPSPRCDFHCLLVAIVRLSANQSPLSLILVRTAWNVLRLPVPVVKKESTRPERRPSGLQLRHDQAHEKPGVRTSSPCGG